MSDEGGDDDERGPIDAAYRTLGTPYRARADAEMDVVGWSLFLGLVVLLVPLLPFLILVWAITKLLDSITRTR
jgi:hypothetical protein